MAEMDQIILIGGTGLLGPTLVHELECAGKEVVCANRSGKHPANGRAEAIDRNSFDDLKRIFRKYSTFTLVDMIPYTARQAALLIEALEGKQPKMIAVSSIDVYQAYNNLHPQGRIILNLQEVPLHETCSLRDRLSFQGIEYDKLNVEHIYWSYFDVCTVLRMPAIYGLPDTSRVERYYEALADQREITLHSGLAKWRFSRSLNTNCAYAVALSLGREQREIFNVAEKRHYTELEWCELIAELMCVEARVRIDDTSPIPFNMNTDQHWIVDSSRIREVLGYEEKYCPKSGLEEVIGVLRTLSIKFEPQQSD